MNLYMLFMIFKNSRSIALLFVCNLILISNVFCQKVACNTITADMNFTVSPVKIIGRWVPKELQAKVEQLIGVNQAFDPSKVGLAQEMVRSEIIESEGKFAIRLLGSTSVLFVTSDVCPVSDSLGLKEVQVVIHPYYLRIDLYNIGNNILPIPRTAKPTFYKQVPSLLLATAPYFGLMNDRRFGTSAFIKTTTDLLHIPGNGTSSGSSKSPLGYLGAKKLRLDFDLDFRKSFNNSFYNSSGLLQLIHPVYADSTIGWSLGIIYAKNLLPLNINDYNRESTKMFAAIHGNGKKSFLSKYRVSAGVEFSQNNYTPLNNKIQNAETGYEFSALIDGRVAKGLSRMGIWFNAGIPKNNINLKPYQRIAGKYGYAVSIGRGHNNVDVAATLGFGYTWATPPTYSEYFADNTASDFLYVPLNSFSNMPFPEGPVIRSLGQREGGFSSAFNSVSGGTSYWGLNLNFSIPISKWSSPLIPDIVILDEPRRITIRSAVKSSVKDAINSIADDLENNGGLSFDEAGTAAEHIVDKDIKPTIDYLADRANIYSIKPEFFFDLGQIYKQGVGDKIWAASGAGLQLNIVNAKLEIGYVQTLFPKSDISKGNFLMRFSVQNFY